MVRRTGNDVPWRDGRDVWYHEEMAGASPECPAEELDAEDPLFILYTSGSTGTPKGVQHSQGGFLLYATLTFKYIFDYHEGDTFLVHRGRGLDHGAYVCDVRAAVERRNHRDVRGGPELPRLQPLLADLRQVRA